MVIALLLGALLLFLSLLLSRSSVVSAWLFRWKIGGLWLGVDQST